MNVHTCGTDKTTYAMYYVKSLCLVQWWMYPHVVLIRLPTPCFISNYYVWFYDECTHMCYWDHYLHHGVRSGLSKTCVYIHHYIWHCDLTYNMVSVV